jgi:hypothetical protein
MADYPFGAAQSKPLRQQAPESAVKILTASFQGKRVARLLALD